MRIGIFSECYLPTLNGVVVSIETFRKEMEKRGHEYFIFAPETKDYEDLAPQKGGPDHVFRFPSFRWPGQATYPIAWPVNHRELAHQISRLNLDIIHTQHLFTMGRAGLWVGRKLGIPVVYTYHTLIAEYTHYVPLLGGLTKHAIIELSQNFCNACDQVATPSPSMKKILLSYGVTTPIEPIPTGINLADLQHPFPETFVRQSWNIPANRKILLYLSRVAKEKNIDFLLRAIRHLAKLRQHKHGQIDFHLLMVGGGPELKFYEQLAKKWGLEHFVTFTDMIKKEVANRYFGVADIFVFPSITETQGIVITEAMAAGTPVVAVDQMGPSDIVKSGDDGYLTDLKIEPFVAKINKLLDDDALRRNMGQKARKHAEDYSGLNCAVKMEKLYEQTIERFAKFNSNRPQSEIT